MFSLNDGKVCPGLNGSGAKPKTSDIPALGAKPEPIANAGNTSVPCLSPCSRTLTSGPSCLWQIYSAFPFGYLSVVDNLRIGFFLVYDNQTATCGVLFFGAWVRVYISSSSSQKT
jgi:hypothetical protein